MIRKKINGVEWDMVTIGELGKLSKKSPITLKKWEEKGWLPMANLRNKSVEKKDGETIKGERLYTKKYALLIADEICKVRKGVEIPNEIIQQLAILFKKERIELMTPKK